jgi:LmbE family N-acetylglucosaminyl deacetylase
MNVVIIAPHPDDEAIGCGGAICLHHAAGDRVAVVFLTSGELGLKTLPKEEAWRVREAESAEAAGILGVASIEFLRQPDWYVTDGIAEAAGALRPILAREQPGLIYVPHPLEWHRDHQAALPVLREALAPLAAGAAHPRLRLYEVWTPLADYDDGENISSVIKQKVRAVRAYRSQVALLRYDRGILGLNQYRGAIAWGCRFAEVFRTETAAPPAPAGSS